MFLLKSNYGVQGGEGKTTVEMGDMVQSIQTLFVAGVGIEEFGGLR
jgi:hypothetical protein